MPTIKTTRPPAHFGADRAEPSRVFRAALLASASLTIMAAAIVSPGLPAMRQVFAAAPDADILVRLVVTITSLAIGLTASAAGALADRVGRKPVLVASLVLYAGAGVSGWFAPDLTVLLGTRALLGLAVGGIMSSVSGMITDLYTGARRAAFLGLQASAASLGGVVFLPLAGALASIRWNLPFWIYAASLLILPFAVFAVRETSERHTRIREPQPPPSAGVRSRREIAIVYGIALAGTLVFFMAPTQLPFLLHGFGASSTVVGLLVAGSTASSAVVAVGYARLRRVLGRGPITIISLSALGAGWIAVGTAAGPVQVLAGVLLGGVGVGLIIPHLNHWLSELVPAVRRGTVLGGLVSAIFLGQFLSPLLLQPLVSAIGTGPAFTVSGAATLFGAGISTAVTRLGGWTRRPSSTR